MELVQVTQELQSASSRLCKGSKELFTLARKFAEKEKIYRDALGKEIVLLKDSGQSVTLIPDIARGKCSQLKFERDLAEFEYTAGKLSLSAIETQVSALQSVLKYQGET
jgi:hypothetical protein